ncbi:type II CAAX endopeptidase family protein [Bacillus sp. REN10]|uniref:CPBP family intramembrane glutamic endopeptidase n=1 Tax=Bacillus sp. REN10 TaxID=2782541 RepID=UPI00193B7441|nr:type II CAAX endopeptidase family protein [Bacillus sp. REN10]
MKKEYGYILIVYLIMQLSGFIGLPLMYKVGVALGVEPKRMETIVPGYWILFSFAVALLIVWLILRKTSENRLERMETLPAGPSTFWAVAGVFLAFFAQRIAISIEMMLGVEMGSQNTETIVNVIEIVPATMISVAVFGPILEEIVFRKIIFGSLHERFSFSISAVLSSLIFAVAHRELEHLLLYTAMGFTFAFLYVKTKRLIVPIFAHVAMNSTVVVVQYFFKDEIERMMKQAEQLQSIIAWLS